VQYGKTEYRVTRLLSLLTFLQQCLASVFVDIRARWGRITHADTVSADAAQSVEEM